MTTADARRRRTSGVSAHGRRSGRAPTAGCQRRSRSRTHTHRSSVKRILSGARLTNAIIAAQGQEPRQNPPAGRGNRHTELAESRTRFLQGRAAATMSGSSISTHVRSSKPGTETSDTPEILLEARINHRNLKRTLPLPYSQSSRVDHLAPTTTANGPKAETRNLVRSVSPYAVTALPMQYTKPSLPPNILRHNSFTERTETPLPRCTFVAPLRAAKGRKGALDQATALVLRGPAAIIPAQNICPLDGLRRCDVKKTRPRWPILRSGQ